MCRQVDFPSSFALVRISAGDTFSRSANDESRVVNSSLSPVRAAYKRSSISSSLNWGAILPSVASAVRTKKMKKFEVEV